MKIKFDEDCITIGDFDSAPVCLIWLHGYGANNWDFEPVMKMVHLKLDEKIFIVIPNAPNDGEKRSWYPLPYKNKEGVLEEDCAGLLDSLSPIRELFHSLIFGSLELKNDKAFLIGGFSQGAALALTAMCDPDTVVDGCISLSGYMPCPHILLEHAEPDGEKLLIGHGEKDSVIDISAHRKALEFLRTLNIDVEEVVGSFGHTVPNEIIDKIIDWILKNYLKKPVDP
jgi:phospholipase/carboxylesterase|tara:strand:+ start:1688 stop:2368 length:681 start_codon:yes stop_codon:yes gene_type:complete